MLPAGHVTVTDLSQEQVDGVAGKRRPRRRHKPSHDVICILHMFSRMLSPSRTCVRSR